MEIKVKSDKEAVNEVLSNLPYGKIDANICFTGGKFGLSVIKAISEKNIDISDLNIFQTDERVETKPEEVIQIQFIKNLKDCRGFNSANFNFFSHKSFDKKVLSDISNKISSFPEGKFDLTILSLGEDGHLAGQFENSIKIYNDMFCFTENSPKLPKKRVSMTVSQLSNSKKIILACLGKNKDVALKNLLSGKSIHSKLTQHKGLILLRN